MISWTYFNPVLYEAINRNRLNTDAWTAVRMDCGLLKSLPHLNFPLLRRGSEKLERARGLRIQLRQWGQAQSTDFTIFNFFSPCPLQAFKCSASWWLILSGCRELQVSMLGNLNILCTDSALILYSHRTCKGIGWHFWFSLLLKLTTNKNTTDRVSESLMWFLLSGDSDIHY